MLKLIFALIKHTFNLLTFRHDGTGFPKERGSLLFLIMVLSVSVNLLHTYLRGDSLGEAGLVATGVTLVFAYAMRPTTVAALLLACLGVELLQCGLLVALATTETTRTITTLALTWKLSAYGVAMFRLRLAENDAHFEEKRKVAESLGGKQTGKVPPEAEKPANLDIQEKS